MSLAGEVSRDRGQPSTVRIGVVVGVSPLQVTVQQTIFTDIGVLDGYVPVVGETVALLGQSAISADGSSWLALGKLASSAVAPAESVAATANGSYTTTSVTFTVVGGLFCAVAFVAPASGKVLVHHMAELYNNTAGAYTAVGVQVATGSTFGAGTVVLAAGYDDSVFIQNPTTGVRAGVSNLVTGLTPGADYNATLYHAVTAGTGTIVRRAVIVTPVV